MTRKGENMFKKKSTIIGLFLVVVMAVVALLAGASAYRRYKAKKYAEEHTNAALLKKAESELAEGEWLITQYDDANGAQSCVYTISTKDKLIIIDGGWIENAEELRKIIAAHNNHVDAWIISHPHRDHAGAFNMIYGDLQGITIDTIYDNSYDYEFVEEVGEPYDDITIMEKFYALTKDAENLVHLKRDEEVDVCGLQIHVYNAFDEAMKEHVGGEFDYQNNGSMCFKVTNHDQSFLYMADIKYDMNDYLYQTYGDELKADYVQLSHHGNWGIAAEYYDQMDAEIYFMDAPDYIVDNPDYPAYSLKAHLIENGKTVYDFTTAPNSVVLR